MARYFALTYCLLGGLLTLLAGCRSERVAFHFTTLPFASDSSTALASTAETPVAQQLHTVAIVAPVATWAKPLSEIPKSHRPVRLTLRHRAAMNAPMLVRSLASSIRQHRIEKPQTKVQDKRDDDFGIAILLFLLALVGGIIFLVGVVTSSLTTLLIGLGLGIVCLLSFLLFTDTI